MKYVSIILVCTINLMAYEYKNYNSQNYNQTYSTYNENQKGNKIVSNDKQNDTNKSSDKKVFEKIPLMNFSDFKSNSDEETVKNFNFLDNYSPKNTFEDCLKNPSIYKINTPNSTKKENECKCVTEIIHSEINEEESKRLIGISYHKNIALSDLLKGNKGSYFGKSFNKEDEEIYSKFNKIGFRKLKECN
jgi:hypothetical protein